MSAAYPTSPFAYPAPRTRTPSGASAETLVLVALILQAIGAVILFGGILFLFGVAAFHPFPFAWLAALVAVIVGGVAVAFLYMAYEYAYLRIQRGEYQAAQTPTLIIGILSIFLGLVPGILYLVGYAKLGDALREQQTSPTTYGPPTTPGAYVPHIACRGCGRVYPLGQFPFCPNCGQKMGP